jgi:hypothetical protein
MSKVNRILAGIAILGAVVAVGVLVGYLASSSGPRAPTVPANPSEQATPRNTSRSTDSGKMTSVQQSPTAKPELSLNPNKPKPKPAPVPPTPGPGPGPVATNAVPDWEEKVDAILTADNDTDAQKAKKMLELFPLLTGDAQEEVAHHISNLLDDENYAALGQYLTNSTLPGDVLDILLEDVLNRPNSIKLPMLLEVARDSQNPKAAEAKDVLELFLEEDYGNDWAKWEVKTKEWLKDNPD